MHGYEEIDAEPVVAREEQTAALRSLFVRVNSGSRETA